MMQFYLLGFIISSLALVIQLVPEAVDIRTWPGWLTIVLWPMLVTLMIVARFDIAVLRALVPKPDDAIEYKDLPDGLRLTITGVLTCVVLGATASMYLWVR
jgi:hypothetical protein